ncbi:hypothetical protein [Thermococcus sp. 2319x1]|uniref:hypothetical protein n=1 Tax=Thermococcus sp. 2319x1 TaxID=1674923 RepID=UPI0011875825|nr:hypothetical protein [Thermococcus sp. 2319x1]
MNTVRRLMPIGVYLLSLAVFVYGVKAELSGSLEGPKWFYLPPIMLTLLSIAYLSERSRFFGGVSLFSAFMLSIFYLADVRVPLIFAIGLLLSLIAILIALPKGMQQISFSERVINIAVGIFSLAVILKALNFVWPDEIKPYIFSLAIIGILLLFFKNRKFSIGGIPLLAMFYTALSYTIYTFNYSLRGYWWVFFAISLTLSFYSLFPLRKVMKG